MGKLTFDRIPPKHIKPPPTREPLDWPTIAEELRRHPGKWARLEHHYASDDTARSAARKSARRYGFEYRTSVVERDEDGRLGIYVRYPRPKTDG